jgi:dephospho-CoA kinase
MPRVIGLTGGIASGKSEVSRILRERGLPVIDVDGVAHEILATDEGIKRQVAAAFGPEVLTVDGAIDRTRLGTLIFRDAERRRDLERILHPMIGTVLRQRTQEADDIVVLDMPLLIELGEHELVDLVVVVYATREHQLQRLMERDGLSREEAIRRIETQLPLDEKVLHADYVINNNGSLQETEEQVIRLYQALRENKKS